MTAAPRPTALPTSSRRAAVPVPREHGAWMMLYAPLLTGLWVYAPPPRATLALLVLATAAFFAQNAAGLLLRGRAAPGTTPWLAAMAAIGVVAGLYLVGGLGHVGLLPLALPAVALFAWQARQRHATRRQVDRTLVNELATTAVLALGAAAAAAVGRGALDGEALLAWSVFVVYFAGTVLYVKMRVAAARRRQPPTAAWRWRSGRLCGLYHLAAWLGLAALLAAASGAGAAALAVLAWAPAALRVGWAWVRLAGGPPPLRRIGVTELVWAAWFSVVMGWALTAA